MASTRARLTAAYGVALVATLLLFAVALWVGRGQAVERTLARRRQMAIPVLDILDQANDQRALFATVPVQRLIADSATGRLVDTVHVLARPVRLRLDSLGEYILLVDSARKTLYASPKVVADSTAFLASLPQLRPGRTGS